MHVYVYIEIKLTHGRAAFSATDENGKCGGAYIYIDVKIQDYQDRDVSENGQYK